MKRKLKVNDFFCGCGGMGIAFKNAGYEIAGAWDFDKYAVESYRANVGDHVQKADIKELHQADIPQADVWAFGFPCQDLSVAGKQRGMILKCEDCGEEIEINPEEYTGNTICPKCSGNNFKAASRSGCFFEMMRLLEETEREREHAMPAVIIAENVRGLRPYLPVLRLEYERHGYTAHIEMFNSKYWNVPQNRDRYAVVGTRNKKNLSFTFPKEQHEFVPKLSDYLEKDVPEKYYLPGEKAQTIIAQAMEKLEKGKDEAAVIRGDQTEEESTLVNEIVRNGYFLPIYFNDRLTGPMFTFNGTCEDAMRYMINRMAAVPLLEVAPGIGDATKITFQATYKNVLTYLSKIARYCELGFRVVPDFKGKKMTFETYKGIDRTTKQGTKPRVIFSESYNNLNRAKHTYSDETAKTKIVVGGAGDGADRIYVTVGGGTGFDLREEFLDAKDINKDDFSTNAEYLEALRIRGEQYKAENAVIENIEAEVEAEVNFIYGTDYDLGDIVTVEKAKWNKVLNLRITELCEVYEYGGMYVVPTFGDALPTTINWDN